MIAVTPQYAPDDTERAVQMPGGQCGGVAL